MTSNLPVEARLRRWDAVPGGDGPSPLTFTLERLSMPSSIDQPNHVLSVVTDPDGDVVFIHGDRAGLEYLRSAIDRLLLKLAEGKTDHDHFRSADWAGSELTTSMLSSEREAGCKTIHHVKIYSWDDEWKKKQGL